MGELINSLKNDPKLAHPKAGAAAKTQKERLARMDVERALLILNRDAVLAEIAKTSGHDRAIAAAEIFGIDAAAYRDMRDMRMKAVTQSTVKFGATFDPDNDDERCKALLQSGRFTMQELAVERRRAVKEHMDNNPDRIIGPGSFHEEQQEPLPQRTLTSTNPAARFNADIDADLNAAAARARSTR